MSNIFLLLLITSIFGIWFYSKEQPNKKNRLIAIILAVISFIGVGLTNQTTSENADIPSQKQSKQTSSFQFDDDSAKEFAIYFKKNAYILDSGNEVEFIVGADKSTISARLGEAWKDESVSRKIYISNELKKEKDRLLEDWLKAKDEATFKKNNLVLIVTVSDSDKTIIAQEIDGEMKIINK